MTPLLASVALCLLGVAIAVGIAWLVIARPLTRRIAALEQQSAGRLSDARPVETVGAAPIVPQPAPPPPAATAERPHAAAAVPADAPAGTPAASPATPTASPATPADAPVPDVGHRPPARSSRVAIVRDRVARYRELLAQRAKPRQLQDLIDEDSTACAVVFDADRGTLSLVPFDANDPGQMLVATAAADDGTFVILPTFEYLESFRVAFSAPAQNPPVVSHLFDLEQDDADGLRLIDPALVRVDEAGMVHKQRSGRMGGYTSGF